jgi:hypothetical protein
VTSIAGPLGTNNDGYDSEADALGYDPRGNLTASGANAYAYTFENLLKTAQNSVSLSYDPALRLYEPVGGGATTRFGEDGSDLIAEYDGGNALLGRPPGNAAFIEQIETRSGRDLPRQTWVKTKGELSAQSL